MLVGTAALLDGCGDTVETIGPSSGSGGEAGGDPMGGGGSDTGIDCGDASDCDSGFCSDGVCCDSACDGVCVSCAGSDNGGQSGVCAPIATGTDPDGECNADPPCGAAGLGCNGDEAAPGCVLADISTECAPAACDMGVATPVAFCDGEGSCNDLIVGLPCVPYACDGDACRDSCNDPSHCAPQHTCVSGACEPLGNLGQACGDATECDSGFCSDGVCCDSACSGGCDVCSVAKGAAADGSCAVLPFGASGEPACAPDLCDGAAGTCMAACVHVDAVPRYNPADVVFVVDNSGSMSDEIAALQANINASFATPLLNTLDLQVIALVLHGASSFELCVPQPLSGNTNCLGPPIEVPGQFRHFSSNIQSHDALCKLLDSLTGDLTDDFGLHPNGWLPYLRQDAFKAFTILSDDGTICTYDGMSWNDNDSQPGGQIVADAWDAALLGISPAQFGTAGQRKYGFFSMIGIIPKNAQNDPYLPSEPYVFQECPNFGSFAPGSAYQQLSILSGGHRSSVCDTANYNVALSNMVASITESARIECRYELPSAPVGMTIDTSHVLVEQTTANGVKNLTQVSGAINCIADAFYLEGSDVVLCPGSCGQAENDPSTELDVAYLCL